MIQLASFTLHYLKVVLFKQKHMIRVARSRLLPSHPESTVAVVPNLPAIRLFSWINHHLWMLGLVLEKTEVC